MRTSLHSHIGKISKQLKCAPIITGGIEDHIHLLARFARTLTQAEWVKEIKRVSNLWLKEKYSIRDFEWQGGYADFSVSASSLELMKKYIENPQHHHRKMNFQDELRTLLKRHKVEWDERYIWD
jgi:REP element-mobilizing transposase RayT